jgi:hypothetical protein
MKIHQLFKEKVSDEVALRIVQCFGLLGMDDTSLFCKNDISKNRTVNRLVTMKDELEIYYLPCKARCYLSCLDTKKCITLLRQVLRLFDLKLNTRQKYVQSKKMTFYNIIKDDKCVDHLVGIRVLNKSTATTINFD